MDRRHRRLARPPAAARRHAGSPGDLARYPWIDFDWPASSPPDRGRPSLDAVLAQLRGAGPERLATVLRLGAAGLFALATGPWLAWLALDLLERLPGGLVRALPVDIGRYRYRTGFVARRAAEDLPPFRALEDAVPRQPRSGGMCGPAECRPGETGRNGRAPARRSR